MLATERLGSLQAADNQLHRAAQSYRRALQMAGEQPLPYIGDAHLGLAQIHYQWNDLDAAQRHGQQGLQLTRGIEHRDKSVAAELFLARLKLVQGDLAGAAAIVDEARRAVQEGNFDMCLPQVAAAQILVALRQGDLAQAAQLAAAHDLPISQARVHLAQEDARAALAALEPARQEMEAKGWRDETLKVIVLQALALHACGETDQALQVLGEALALAEPGDFIRIFLDEGAPMAQLLHQAAAHGTTADYANRLLTVFEDATQDKERTTELSRPVPHPPSLVEPLSRRELEVLQLIARGLSNREIGERLFLALDTVKGHNRRIYGKLQVQRRTEAVARARELGLL
jgi:LuxR family maltose regulon positive regulatory protein